MNVMRLTPEQEAILKSWPPNYRQMAVNQIKRGRAFCPSCHWAGISNCSEFDVCGHNVYPVGDQLREQTA